MNKSTSVIHAAIAAVVAAGSLASAAAITPGDLVVVRAGGTATNGAGAAALTTAGASVFLDEYTTTGTYVQSLSVSNAGTDALVLSGSSGTEGLLTPSQDGTKLVFGGYRSTVGASSTTLMATGTARVAAMVDASGNVDTSFSTTGVGTGALRSAVTNSGGNFWLGTSVGVYYAPTSGSSSTLIENRNSRQVFLANGNLYATNGSTGTAAKVQHYGQSPTSATPATPIVTLSTADVTQGLYFLDLSPSVAGVDTLYFVNQNTNAIAKYSFNGSTWSSNGTIAGVTGIADVLAVANGSAVDLYLTTAGAISKATDTSGFGGTITGTLSTLVTAPTNTGFRGISSLPAPANTTTVVLPEPTSVACIGGLSAMLLRRRGR